MLKPIQTDHHEISEEPAGKVTLYARPELQRRGLEPDESPLLMNVTVKNARAVLERVGLPQTSQFSEMMIDAVGSIVVNLALIPNGHGVFYSRDKEHYSALSLYRPNFYTYSTILGAVDYLEKSGLVEHRRTRPSRSATHRSSLRTTHALASAIVGLRSADVSFRPPQCIVLRAADKSPVTYRDTEFTRKARRAVLEQNQFMEQFSVSVMHSEARLDERGFLIIGEQRFCQTACSAHRVFSGSFRRGGRWYGPFWQGLPSRIREGGLRIDGERVIELDYRACHFRILCRLARVEEPEHDPFSIPPFVRSEIKLGFNILLNASHPKVALCAIAGELASGGEDWEMAKARSRLLLEAVIAAFPAFANYWNTCFGLRLQYLDSEVCGRVLEMLRKESIPALSVHDSFIVAARHANTLAEIMREGFEREMRNVA